MFVPVDIDDEWREWYHSPKQKFLRKLEEAFGGEGVLICLGYKLNTALKFGWLHGVPNFFGGFGLQQGKRETFVIAGFVQTCSGMQVSILNKLMTVYKRDCPGCADERQRFADAKQRIMDDMLAHQEKHEQKQGVRKGALTEWPTA